MRIRDRVKSAFLGTAYAGDENSNYNALSVAINAGSGRSGQHYLVGRQGNKNEDETALLLRLGAVGLGLFRLCTR